MNISVSIPNMAAFQAKLKAFPAVAAVQLDQAINLSLVSILGKVKSGADTPIGTSGGAGLRDNWSVTMGNLSGTLESNSKYATFVEKGTKPHFPPIDAITPWAVSKGLSPFLVARAISIHGTKPNPFLERAITESKDERSGFFSAALGNIVKQTANI